MTVHKLALQVLERMERQAELLAGAGGFYSEDELFELIQATLNEHGLSLNDDDVIDVINLLVVEKDGKGLIVEYTSGGDEFRYRSKVAHSVGFYQR